MENVNGCINQFIGKSHFCYRRGMAKEVIAISGSGRRKEGEEKREETHKAEFCGFVISIKKNRKRKKKIVI